jgi:imidazole glycerol phosphate synthase subunit HisF
MKTFFLLITLTQNGAGDINASFVNTETLQQCQQKAEMVESVFTASSIPVIESRCIKSEMKFSEFGHASTASKIRHFYLIHLDEITLDITAMPDWRSCVDRKKSESRQGSVYCASSIQSVR